MHNRRNERTTNNQENESVKIKRWELRLKFVEVVLIGFITIALTVISNNTASKELQLNLAQTLPSFTIVRNRGNDTNIGINNNNGYYTGLTTSIISYMRFYQYEKVDYYDQGSNDVEVDCFVPVVDYWDNAFLKSQNEIVRWESREFSKYDKFAMEAENRYDGYTMDLVSIICISFEDAIGKTHRLYYKTFEYSDLVHTDRWLSEEEYNRVYSYYERESLKNVWDIPQNNDSVLEIIANTVS